MTVTIIILLIISGVSITALTQTNLFINARKAKGTAENAQIDENNKLKEYNNNIEMYISASNRESGNSQYSLDETEIGTWIDGKKLYRKVFVLENFNINKKIDISDLNYDYIRLSSRIKNYYKCLERNFCYPDGNCFVDYIDANSQIRFNTTSSVASVYNNGTVYCIVEYTKKIKNVENCDEKYNKNTIYYCNIRHFIVLYKH